MGEVGAATGHEPSLGEVTCRHFHLTTDQITMVTGMEFNANPASSRIRDVSQNGSRLVDITDHQVHPAVVVQITRCQPPAMVPALEVGATRLGHHDKPPAAPIPQEGRRLSDGRADRMPNDVSVGDHDVFPAVPVKIDNLSAKPDKRQPHCSHTAGATGKREEPIAVVAVKRGQFVLVVGHKNSWPTAAKWISNREPHAAIGHSTVVAGNTGSCSSLLEALTLIEKQQIGFGVVGHIDIWPAIVIHISNNHPEPLHCRQAPRPQQPDFGSDVREGAVTVVAIERIGQRIERFGWADVGERRVVIGASGMVGKRPVDIPAEVKITVAIAIKIGPGSRGAPRGLAIGDGAGRQSCRSSHIGPRTTVVVVEGQATVASDQQIVSTIPIVVCDCSAMAVKSCRVEPDGGRDVGEPEITIIPIERRWTAHDFAATCAGKSTTTRQKEVEIPILIAINQSHAATE